MAVSVGPRIPRSNPGGRSACGEPLIRDDRDGSRCVIRRAAGSPGHPEGGRTDPAWCRMQMLGPRLPINTNGSPSCKRRVKGFTPKGCCPFRPTGSCRGSRTYIPRSSWRFIALSAPMRAAGLDAIVQAYRLYNDHPVFRMEQVLSLTRAWTLIRFLRRQASAVSQMYVLWRGVCCHAFDPTNDYICGLCHVPSRAARPKETAVPADLLPDLPFRSKS